MQGHVIHSIIIIIIIIVIFFNIHSKAKTKKERKNWPLKRTLNKIDHIIITI